MGDAVDTDPGNRSRMVFACSLQRSPPMAWDLDYSPEHDPDDDFDDVDVGSGSGGSDSDMSVCSICTFAASSETLPGFDLRYCPTFLQQFGEAQGEAERMAYCMLRLGRATEKQLQQHFDLLPTRAHKRNSMFHDDDAPQAASLNMGAFVHGGIIGCHKTVNTHPWSIRLWTSVVKAVQPDHSFTSLSLAKNTISTLHSDLHNRPGSSNLVISICSQTCSGGSLWVSDEAGNAVHAGAGRGRILPLSTTGVFFNPRLPHFSYEFQGTRFVAIAYHIRDAWRLSAELTRRLLSLGFCPAEITPEISDPYQLVTE